MNRFIKLVYSENKAIKIEYNKFVRTNVRVLGDIFTDDLTFAFAGKGGWLQCSKQLFA